jgi:Protein of unknown function (DUF3046)
MQFQVSGATNGGWKAPSRIYVSDQPVCARVLQGLPYPGDVRLTEFWARMRTQFGDVYAQSVARDYVFARLGGRTIERALADGEDAKVVWRAVCETFDVAENLR